MGKRAGRPRSNKPRTPSGQISRAGEGPLSHLDRAKRDILVQREDGSYGNPAYSTYPLGRLMGSGGITEEMHRAGGHFAWLYARAISKKPTCTAISFDPTGWGHSDDDPRHLREWDAAKSALCRVSRQTFDAVFNIAVEERAPRWMLALPPRAQDVKDSQAMLDALSLLAEHFGMIGKRAA